MNNEKHMKLKDIWTKVHEAVIFMSKNSIIRQYCPSFHHLECKRPKKEKIFQNGYQFVFDQHDSILY